jgi:hypothetical protein
MSKDQQKGLRIQKAKLGLQQLKTIGWLGEPVRNEAHYDGRFVITRAESQLSWQELDLFD